MAVTYSYDDLAIREDLLDIITNIDPVETQLMTGLGTSTANQILHQWSTDTLSSVGNNAATEGAAFSSGTRTNPARLLNYTQIVKKDYSVSDTDRASKAAGFADRYQYEMEKAMKEWKRDCEYALMRGSLVCGSGSAARQLKGVKNWLTLATSQSGVSYTEALLNDRLQDVWTQGVQVNALYCPMYIKRKISGFTSGTTKNINADDKRLVNSIDVYQADAASMVKLFSHRYVTVSGDTNYDIVGINEDYFKIAYLEGRKPQNREMAKVGDSTDAQVLGELTLECRSQYAGFWVQKAL